MQIYQNHATRHDLVSPLPVKGSQYMVKQFYRTSRKSIKQAATVFSYVQENTIVTSQPPFDMFLPWRWLFRTIWEIEPCIVFGCSVSILCDIAISYLPKSYYSIDRSLKWITKSGTAYSTEEPWQVRNPAPNTEQSCEANGSNSQIPDRNFIRPNRPHPPSSYSKDVPNKTAKKNGNAKEPESWCRFFHASSSECQKNHTWKRSTIQVLGAPEKITLTNRTS